MPSDAAEAAAAAISSSCREPGRVSLPRLYNKWFKEYSSSHSDVQIDYQSVGSGQGVKSVMDGTVDFGASDAAMKPEEMEQVASGVQLLPMTAGSIVLAYNLEGVERI